MTAQPPLDVSHPDPPLTDGEIYLRPLAFRHVEPLTELAQDPDVARHTYVSLPFTTEDGVAWVARYVEGWKDGTRAGFAIEGEDGTFLGFCSLVTIEREGRQAEVGYITVPNARGRGIGTRSLDLITRWSFDRLGLERLELKIDITNQASAAMAKRAGYVLEGVLRNNYFKDGLRIDLAIYSRLRTD